MSNMNDALGLRMPYGKTKTQYQTEFDPATGTVWGYFNPKGGTACFSLGLMKDILAHDQQLMANGGKIEFEGAMHEVNYYVTGSRIPRVFNLGGDLALFVLLIKARDREALAHYAKLCIDNMYPRSQSFFSPTLTKIALVQGDALGRRFRVRTGLRRDHCRGKRATGVSRNPLQPVSGNGRLQSARAPHRYACGGRTHSFRQDTDRQAIARDGRN